MWNISFLFQNLGGGYDVWSNLEAELNDLIKTAHDGPGVLEPWRRACADVKPTPEPVEQKPSVILPEVCSIFCSPGELNVITWCQSVVITCCW
jgi:hypothetical protein